MVYVQNQIFPRYFPISWVLAPERVVQDTTDEYTDEQSNSWQVRFFGNRLNPFRINL